MTVGPISWRDILMYGQMSELEPDLLDAFISIIRAMDNGFLKSIEKKGSDSG